MNKDFDDLGFNITNQNQITKLLLLYSNNKLTLMKNQSIPQSANYLLHSDSRFTETTHLKINVMVKHQRNKKFKNSKAYTLYSSAVS